MTVWNISKKHKKSKHNYIQIITFFNATYLIVQSCSAVIKSSESNIDANLGTAFRVVIYPLIWSIFSFSACLFIKMISFKMLFKYISLLSSSITALFWYPFKKPYSILIFWMNRPTWLMNCVKSIWHNFLTLESLFITKSGFDSLSKN